MSIFDLHAKVIADYQEYIRAYINVSDERIREFVDQSLIEEQKLWPEFLLQLSPAYERTATVDELAARGILHPETARIFCAPGRKIFPSLSPSSRGKGLSRRRCSI